MTDTVAEVQLWPVVAPLRRPIRTAFGQMQTRPALLLCLTDTAGHHGWGEAWVNFPDWGLTVNTIVLHALARRLPGIAVDPETVTASLFADTQTQMLQSGQFGPIYQALSAIDQALWDLRWQSEPVVKSQRVSVYASGIGPEDVARRVEDALGHGFRDVKIKVGFDVREDRAHFLAACDIAGATHVAVDANQGWDYATANQEIPWYLDHGARWVEEPLAALDFAHYRAFDNLAFGLAAGENWLPEHFDGTPPRVHWIQPDLAKVGGLWGSHRLLQRLAGRFHSVAFHVLGTLVNHAAALAASASGKDETVTVEYDTNENPFHSLMEPDWTIRDGFAWLGKRPGLGVWVDVALLERYVDPQLRPWCRVDP